MMGGQGGVGCMKEKILVGWERKNALQDDSCVANHSKKVQVSAIGRE
jgi:hypothetical protein